MKRTLALLLAAVMMLLAVPFVSNAAPEGKCVKFDNDHGAYMQMNDGITVSPSHCMRIGLS